MTRVEVSVDITRPVEEVFEFITTFTNNVLWQNGVLEAKITSSGPLGVGSTYAQSSKFLGQRLQFSFEVLEFEPNRMIHFKTTSGTFPVDIVRSVEAIPGGTRVTAIIQGEASGIFKLAAPILDRMTQRQINADYGNLKELLDARNEVMA